MDRAIISVKGETFEVLRKMKLVFNSRNPRKMYTWDDFFKELLKR